ncbi:MAG: hypothetical protein HYU81_01020 [Candidatus Brennerbacteria bacterium]|nr:hypothetical protein [Candidatus Brennerbacteria bacterium]
MVKRGWWIAVGAILLGGTVFAVWGGKPAEAPGRRIDESSAAPVELQTPPDAGMGVANIRVVKITTEGFEPASVTTKQGGTVMWINESDRNAWPASAIHPVHTVYPGSSIQKCGGADEGLIFDACRSIAPGASWSFTFGEIGTWRYHDHLRPSLIGAVVVE